MQKSVDVSVVALVHMIYIDITLWMFLVEGSSSVL